MEGRDQPLLAFCHFFKWTLQVYTVEKGRVPCHVIIALLGLSPDLQIPEASEVCPLPDSNLFILLLLLLSSKITK
jgi:hypothetical protein